MAGTLRSALRTRLLSRLGITSSSTAQSSLLNEAINAGISRALSDGVPGLSRRTFVGTTYGTYTATDTVTATAGNSYFATTASEVFTGKNIFPGDVLNIGSIQRLVDYVDPAVAGRVHFGAPVSATLTGVALTIERRSIQIPGTGPVIRVSDPTNTKTTGRLARHDSDGAAFSPFETGGGWSNMRTFTQGYDGRGSGSSFIGLYPAPTSATESLIIQADFYDELDEDADKVFFPEPALDAILERSRLAYLSWTGESDQIRVGLAQAVVADTADELTNTSNPTKVFRKG